MKSENGERIEQDISFWINKEKGLKELFRNDIVNEEHFLKEKFRYFSSVRDKYDGKVSQGDQITLNVLNGEIKKLEHQIYPNPIVRLLAKIERIINKIKERSKPIIANRIKSHALNFNPKKFLHDSNTIKETTQANNQEFVQDQNNKIFQPQKNEQKNDNRMVNDYKARLSLKNNLHQGRKIKHKLR